MPPDMKWTVNKYSITFVSFGKYSWHFVTKSTSTDNIDS